MKTKDITINNKEYQVKELSYDVVMDLVESVEANQLTREVAKRSITCEGKPVDFTEIGFTTGLKLSTLVSEIHDLGGNSEEKNG